jgi:hypothetical protein
MFTLKYGVILGNFIIFLIDMSVCLGPLSNLTCTCLESVTFEIFPTNIISFLIILVLIFFLNLYLSNNSLKGRFSLLSCPPAIIYLLF